jgi:peptidoglycan/xylan/chitin deacetylase (PgdA/CDA1 family)
MTYDPAIHSGRHLLKHMLGCLERLLPGSDGPDVLIVLNYHGTPRKFLHGLREQLNYYGDHFTFLAPSDLGPFYEGKLAAPARPRLLLTFDDGLKNNLNAAEMLAAAGIHAFFFVIPEFVDTAESDQSTFYRRYVRQAINPAIDSEVADFIALSWKDIRSLRSEGHAIGSHSSTHTLLATDDFDKSRDEIEESRRRIAVGLEAPLETVNAYCAPNDTLMSTGETQLRLVRENYRFFFTSLPGTNKPASDTMFIRRSNVEVFWLPGAVAYSIGRFDRLRWRKQIAAYSQMGCET